MAVMVAVLSMAGRTVDSLFEEFRTEKHATYVSIPPTAMGLAKMFTKDLKDDAKISSMKILSIEKCSRGAKKKILKAFKQCDFEGYEPIISVEKKNETTMVLAKSEDIYISELVLLSIEGKNVNIIKICGQFSPENIDSVVDSASKSI